MKAVAYDTVRSFALFYILKCFVCNVCVCEGEREREKLRRKNVHIEHLNMQLGILFQFPEVNDLFFLPPLCLFFISHDAPPFHLFGSKIYFYGYMCLWYVKEL